jgi:hypothetical protein
MRFRSTAEGETRRETTTLARESGEDDTCCLIVTRGNRVVRAEVKRIKEGSRLARLSIAYNC